MWGSGVWPEWVTSPKGTDIYKNQWYLWRNFYTVASEPECGVEVGEGHFAPHDSSHPLFCAEAEHPTEGWAEPEGSGGSCWNSVISNVCFHRCRMRLTMATVHRHDLYTTSFLVPPKVPTLFLDLVVQKHNQNSKWVEQHDHSCSDPSCARH
jgi:hypothetical protein